MFPTYQNTIEKYLSSFHLITLTKENEIKAVKCLKQGLERHTILTGEKVPSDPKRWSVMKMILCGEAALEQFLGINVVNYNLTEKGWYNSKGLNQGKVLIKVFPQGTFPIIYQHNTKPMVFVMQMDSRNYRICGYAKTQVLNSYKSVQMVPKTEYDFDRKACFYGFDELKDFTEMDVLEAVLGG